MTPIRFLETSLRKKIFQSLQNYSTLINKIPKRIFETYAKHILHHDGSSLHGARVGMVNF